MVEAHNSDAVPGSVEPKNDVAEGFPTRRSRRSNSTVSAAKKPKAVKVASAGAPKVARKNPASVLLTMVAVGGMFAVVALPAYAFSPTEAPAESLVASVGQQSIEVDADVASIGAARDAFTATTPEQLAQQRTAAALAAAYRSTSSSSSVSYTRDPADDYPWRGGGGLSPLRYYKGECVDFVAWRLNRDQGSTSAPFKWDWGTMTPGGGSARYWKSAWESKGWPVSNTPIVGSVAWFGGGNHVAYVKEVLGDGTVVLEEYNAGIYHGYSQRIMNASSIAAFLYPPS